MLPMGNMEMVIFYLYNFYTNWCDVFTCKKVFYTPWSDLIPLAGTNFYRDNWSLARANRAVVTNNLTMIIEVMLIEVVLPEGFLYLLFWIVKIVWHSMTFSIVNLKQLAELSIGCIVSCPMLNPVSNVILILDYLNFEALTFFYWQFVGTCTTLYSMV